MSNYFYDENEHENLWTNERDDNEGWYDESDEIWEDTWDFSQDLHEGYDEADDENEDDE